MIPTQAQKDAGNYRKKHVRFCGMAITVENQRGTSRSGVGSDGKRWTSLMNNDYGYIRGTVGKDGDHIDCFLGNNQKSQIVFIVNQKDTKTGKFDEHKVMLGFDTLEQAKSAYLSNYELGWDGIMSIIPMSIPRFRKWAFSGKRKIGQVLLDMDKVKVVCFGNFQATKDLIRKLKSDKIRIERTRWGRTEVGPDDLGNTVIRVYKPKHLNGNKSSNPIKKLWHESGHVYSTPSKEYMKMATGHDRIKANVLRKDHNAELPKTDPFQDVLGERSADRWAIENMRKMGGDPKGYAKWRITPHRTYTKEAGYSLMSKLKEINFSRSGLVPFDEEKHNELLRNTKVIVQPKLDGVFAEGRQDGQIYSRSGNPITTQPHISAKIKNFFKRNPKANPIKGELYTHGKPFEDITSAVKSGNDQLQYHVFPDGTKKQSLPRRSKFIQRVESKTVSDPETAKKEYDNALKQGYEGQVLRTSEGKVFKRKPLSDEEFRLLAVRQGKPGKVGSATFQTQDGRTFKAPSSGLLPEQVGKPVTVQYSHKSRRGIPKAARVKGARDYENIA